MTTKAIIIWASVAVLIVVGAILTYVYWWKPKQAKAAASKKVATSPLATESSTNGTVDKDSSAVNSATADSAGNTSAAMPG